VPDEAPAPPIVAGDRNNEVVVSEDNSFDEEDYDDTTAEEMGSMENNETVVSADESPTQDGPNVGEMGETTAVLAPKPFGARAGGVRSDGQRAISAGDSFVVSVLRVTKGTSSSLAFPPSPFSSPLAFCPSYLGSAVRVNHQVGGGGMHLLC
jgi:hypothetical protein